MEILTADELSELLRLPKGKIVVLARRGEIPAFTLLGKLRFSANEIEEWLKQNGLASNGKVVAQGTPGAVKGHRHE